MVSFGPVSAKLHTDTSGLESLITTPAPQLANWQMLPTKRRMLVCLCVSVCICTFFQGRQILKNNYTNKKRFVRYQSAVILHHSGVIFFSFFGFSVTVHCSVCYMASCVAVELLLSSWQCELHWQRDYLSSVQTLSMQHCHVFVSLFLVTNHRLLCFFTVHLPSDMTRYLKNAFLHLILSNAMILMLWFWCYDFIHYLFDVGFSSLSGLY